MFVLGLLSFCFSALFILWIHFQKPEKLTIMSFLGSWDTKTLHLPFFFFSTFCPIFKFFFYQKIQRISSCFTFKKWNRQSALSSQTRHHQAILHFYTLFPFTGRFLRARNKPCSLLSPQYLAMIMCPCMPITWMESTPKCPWIILGSEHVSPAQPLQCSTCTCN